MVFERYIDDSYKSLGAQDGHRAGIRPPHLPGRGRTVHARKGQVSDGGARLPQCRAQGDEAFRARRQAAASAPRAACSDMDEQGVDVQIMYPTAAGQMLGREFREPSCSRRAAAPTTIGLLTTARRSEATREVGGDSADAGRGRSDQGSESRGEKGLHQLLHAAQSGRAAIPVQRRLLPLWAEIEKLGKPISTHESGLGVGPVIRRSDGYSRQRPHPVASVRSDGRDGRSHLVRHLRKIPEAKVMHVEADGGWVPYWLQRMEQHWDFSGNAEHEYLTLRPTEYFKRTSSSRSAATNRR